MGVRRVRAARDGDVTHTEDDAAFRELLAVRLLLGCVKRAVLPKLHGCYALVVLELRANLGRDRVGPRLRDVEVITEYLGENFGLDEGLVDIPHEAVPDAVRVGLEFDADGDERCALRRMALKHVGRPGISKNTDMNDGSEPIISYAQVCMGGGEHQPRL